MVVGDLFAVPEPLPEEKRHKGGVRPLLVSIGGVLLDRGYTGYLVGFIFSFVTMFTYVASSPFVLQYRHGFSPVEYSWIFGMNTLGMFFVAMLNARLVKKIGPGPLARWGNVVLVVATVYILVISIMDAPRYFLLVGFFVVVVSMGVNFANFSALAMSRAQG